MVSRFWPAVVVTSLFFGAAHLELGSGGPLVWAAAVDTFLLSVVLCFLRERSGALYAGMLVHMANNLVAFGVHFK
jgi:membrane protease YdiL (CAAX protease family)